MYTDFAEDIKPFVTPMGLEHLLNTTATVEGLGKSAKIIYHLATGKMKLVN
jgi:hypothetical protein